MGLERGAANALLLTATVRPPEGARNIARTDPLLRLADYLDAFDFYLTELRAGTAGSIVLCENSGYDLAPFADRADRAGLAAQVELISYEGLDHPALLGRGYGEFKLVDHAMATSRRLSALGANGVVWKVTGRYKIRNLATLIAGRPADADLYVHCRNHPLRWLDMFLMAWNRRGYEGLVRGVYPRLAQDETQVSAEELFRRVLDESDKGLRIVRRFNRTPVIDGIRAGNNINYLDERGKYIARVIASFVAPWLWI